MCVCVGKVAKTVLDGHVARLNERFEKEGSQLIWQVDKIKVRECGS